MSITLTLGDKKWKVFEEYECSVLSSHWIHFSVVCSMAKESGETHPSLEKTSERFEGENRCRCGSKELKEHKRVETESESWGWDWEWFHPLFSCIITPREMFGLEGRRVSWGQTEGGVVPLSHCSPTTTLKWLRTDRVFPEKNSHSTQESLESQLSLNTQKRWLSKKEIFRVTAIIKVEMGISALKSMSSHLWRLPAQCTIQGQTSNTTTHVSA